MADLPKTAEIVPISKAAKKVEGDPEVCTDINCRRTNNAMQQKHFPGDKGFEFAGKQQEGLMWGDLEVPD